MKVENMKIELIFGIQVKRTDVSDNQILYSKYNTRSKILVRTSYKIINSRLENESFFCWINSGTALDLDSNVIIIWITLHSTSTLSIAKSWCSQHVRMKILHYALIYGNYYYIKEINCVCAHNMPITAIRMKHRRN